MKNYREMESLKKIVCFGDSNTYGYVPALGDRFDENTRWAGRLKNSLAKRGMTVIEEGKNGRTTVFDDPVEEGRNGSLVFDSVLREHDPVDCLVIMLGTNDCKIKFAADEEVITKGLEVLVSMARVFDPGIRILIVSPAVVNEGVKLGRFAENFDDRSIEVSKRLAVRYSELARKCGCAFLDAAKYAETDPSDGIHLGAQAHSRLAQAVETCLLNMLSDGTE